MGKPCGADDKHAADDWTSADEKTLCYKHILNSLSLLNQPIFFRKTWWCAQRKSDRHCALISIVWTSVFFKVFERVSWWSFRVPTPFSLLCLIHFNWFSQKHKFPSKYAYYLNSILTFDEQTKDNFINIMFQCRPTCSFIHSISCPLFFWRESQGQQS